MKNKIFDKLKDTFKEFGKRDAIICAAAIVIIVIAAGIYLGREKDESVSAPVPSPSQDVSTDIEKRLESILSKIEGAGNIDVMITARDTVSSNIDGENYYETIGAIILSEGADDLGVRVKIQQAVQTALGIEAQQIKIFKLSSE